MQLPRIFYSKIFLIGVVILLLGIFTLQFRQWQQRRAINAEIAALIQEEQELEQKNKDLAQSLQYFSSDNYKEQLARQQLGLKREGEIVVNFPSNLNSGEENKPAPKLSNPQKWWQYFFLKNVN